MAELLKNYYNQQFFDRLTKAIQKFEPDFDQASFLNQIFDPNWDQKELKERMRHCTLALNDHLKGDFAANANLLTKTIPEFNEAGNSMELLGFLFYPDFIEVFGIDHYQTSISAIEKITQFISCEFAVRPFIIQNETKMMKQMLAWSKHKNSLVRRLASEGCRPRLPWAMAIKFLKQDPDSILPILENLKNDESLFVRRSVANNLNDISKDHPELVIKLVKSWKGKTEETDWVLKHACRTLLKQGNQEVLRAFGFAAPESIEIDHFKIQNANIKIGEALEFSFQLKNISDADKKVRLEYGLYYQKANGSLSRKVFQIGEKNYAGNSITNINRKQSFKIITTRKFHPGKHQLSLIVNGIEQEKLDFELIG